MNMNMNMKMNGELKKIVSRVKATQAQLQTLLKDRTWVEDARKYAESQGKEVKKLLSADVDRVRTFIERHRKELERFQRQIPGEVKKFRKFVDGQKREFEKLLKNVRKAKVKGAKSKGKKSGLSKNKTATGSGGARKRSISGASPSA